MSLHDGLLCYCKLLIFLMFVGNTNVLEMLSHWKQLKLLLDMGTWKHLVSLIQAFYAEQTATMRSKDLSTAFSFSTGKGTRQGCNISAVEFNMVAQDIKRRTLENSQQGINVGGILVNNLRYADDITLRRVHVRDGGRGLV